MRVCGVGLLLVVAALYTVPQSWARRGRLRRHLVWPDADGQVELILGLGLPTKVQGHDVTLGATVKAAYELPSNATQLFTQAAERALGTLSRWHLYAAAEAALDSMGVDGRACVLRAICEAAETPLRQDSLLAEITHLLLTPSLTDADSGEGRRYLAAERAGAAAGGGGGGGGGGVCAALYRECAASPLHYVTALTSP